MCGILGKVWIKDMAVANIVALFVSLIYFSYIWKKKFVEMLPVLTCMLALILYALAMIGYLSWIDWISVIVTAAFLIWLIRIDKGKRAEFAKTFRENVTHASFISALILLVCVIICTSGKVVSWWDDVNFWAADVKSLYYLDRFACKYGNVAPEFGDYPPGAQLIKWWFLHLDPVNYREGLAFAGYYTMNIVFMLPILRKLKDKNVVMMLLLPLSLWFLPSIAEVYGYDGFCADLTLACIYGGFLFAVTDEDDDREKSGNFYYIRLALYLGLMVLVKSVGFIWAAFGLVFFWCCQRSVKKNLIVPAAPLVIGGSWMLFCIIMRRVTRTTTTAVKYMVTDEYGFSGYMDDFAKAFKEAFIGLPLHQEKSALINLTPLAFYICICLIVVFFCRKGLMPKRQGRLVLGYSILSGAIFYGIIFMAHITIFATETQYLEASGMISSIERYGAPFTIGTLIFLANIWVEYGGVMFEKEKLHAIFRNMAFLSKYGIYLVFVLFIALTAGYTTGYHGLIGYRSEVERQLGLRADMLSEDAETFLEALQTVKLASGIRVCCIQRDDEPRWVGNSYTNLEASPISVVYKSINLDDAPQDWMVEQIRASHADYLYVEETPADASAVFGAITTDGDFACETMYFIIDDGVQLELLPLR